MSNSIEFGLCMRTGSAWSEMPLCRVESCEQFESRYLRIATLTFDQYGHEKEMVVLFSPDGLLTGYTTGRKWGPRPGDAEKQCRDALTSQVYLQYVCPYEPTTRF